MFKTQTLRSKNMFVLHLTLDFLLILVSSVTGADECNGRPEVISPREWRAREPVRATPMRWPVSHFIIAHTVTPECFTKPQCIRAVQFIQDFHMDQMGWWNIGYSFLIGGDGRVYVGNGWNNTGAHTINFNTNSVGVAFMGDFMKVAPNEKMISAALNLIKCGIRKGYLTPSVEVHGHRDVSCTKSPGDVLYRIIRTWKNYKGGRMNDFYCNKDPNDDRYAESD